MADVIVKCGVHPSTEEMEAVGPGLQLCTLGVPSLKVQMRLCLNVTSLHSTHTLAYMQVAICRSEIKVSQLKNLSSSPLAGTTICSPVLNIRTKAK